MVKGNNGESEILQKDAGHKSYIQNNKMEQAKRVGKPQNRAFDFDNDNSKKSKAMIDPEDVVPLDGNRDDF